MMTAPTRQTQIQALMKRTSTRISCFSSKRFTLSNITTLVGGLHLLQITVTGS
ncbi:hypothetical protein PSHT_01277 [Puccinia striiformis]|uniref:Uncharacterized protein n=2 Tax=Puccinia striiformis TaxID=27350 RepID=A0A2S4WL52_9BASI|nr:hypothetical protein PSTT_01335 [Puccinia striiformis]POW22427.1 hypothetical protein PSHT_01277 [Puccinia striiformis]